MNGHGKDGRFQMRYQPNEPRHCPRCVEQGRTEILDAENFYAKDRNPDGSIKTRGTYCKRCCRERQRELRGHRPKDMSRQSEAARRMRRKAAYARLKRDPERAAKLRAAKREQARRRRERAKTDPAVDAAIRATTKRHYDKLRNDPQLWEDKLIDARIRYRDAKESEVRETNAVGAYRAPSAKDAVDAEPFLAYLQVAFPDASSEALEALTGIPSTRFREIKRGKERLTLDLIDRALTRGLGRPDLVAALYPYNGGT